MKTLFCNTRDFFTGYAVIKNAKSSGKINANTEKMSENKIINKLHFYANNIYK